jgi:CheY-like chemotaxis protein
MSPEQTRGYPLDGRSDIYSIGVIAFEMLTGQLPFDGDPLTVALHQLHDPPPDEELTFAEVPREMVALVRRCMMKQPESRFQTAAELAATLTLLERILKGAPPSEGRTSRARPDEAEEMGPEDVADAPRNAPTQVRASDEHTMRRQPFVLVVDDEKGIREVVATFLRKSGCDVRTAESGEAALTELVKQPADLLILDVNMPVIDGFDTARIVKSQKALARIPILFMSGVVDRGRLAFAAQSGAVDFLAKPLDFRRLVAKSWEILRDHGFAPPPGLLG